MENLRRECANRHCQRKRPRHCGPAPAEHRHLPDPRPGPAKSSQAALVELTTETASDNLDEMGTAARGPDQMGRRGQEGAGGERSHTESSPGAQATCSTQGNTTDGTGLPEEKPREPGLHLRSQDVFISSKPPTKGQWPVGEAALTCFKHHAVCEVGPGVFLFCVSYNVIQANHILAMRAPGRRACPPVCLSGPGLFSRACSLGPDCAAESQVPELLPETARASD